MAGGRSATFLMGLWGMFLLGDEEESVWGIAYIYVLAVFVSTYF
jgi:hypothetical protein